jgi:hypothetical protein
VSRKTVEKWVKALRKRREHDGWRDGRDADRPRSKHKSAYSSEISKGNQTSMDAAGVVVAQVIAQDGRQRLQSP